MKIKQYIIGCMAFILALSLIACKKEPSINSKNSDTASQTALESSNSISTDTSSLEKTSSAVSYTDTVSDASQTANSSSAASTASVVSAKPSVTITSTASHTHNWSSKTIAATCTEQGYTLKTCTCGETEKVSHVKALGHNWGEWTTVKAATTTATGTQQRACSRCKITETKTLDKLPSAAEDFCQEVFELVNAERAKAGLAPLTYYSAAQSAADIRTEEIMTHFSHTRPDGSSCFTALDALNISYWAAGENIAAGQRSPQEVMQGWMNSEGHRANILNSNFNAIVVGYKNNHWVQLFLKVR